jgi:polyphosphate kinase
MAYKEIVHDLYKSYSFFDRDLSWLSFNERVLMEAERTEVPLMERLNFLAIYSSNLDEFYRVRMPALSALHKLYKKEKLEADEAARHADVEAEARAIVDAQLNRFGRALETIIPQLAAQNVFLYYGTEWPAEIKSELTHYFFTEVLAFLQPVHLGSSAAPFFPENNKVYLAVSGQEQDGKPQLVIVNLPTDSLPRFYKVVQGDITHIVFLDDIIKQHLDIVLPQIVVDGCWSFKVNRDAELSLGDDYTEDMAAKIEKQIAKRDNGLATRLLHEPGLPVAAKELLLQHLQLPRKVLVEGGRYHNLRDLSSLPVSLPELKYAKWPSIHHPVSKSRLLLHQLEHEDVLLHTPFHAYDAVLRFFNEAAIHPEVEHIYLTMYRVAADSRIANALLSAANNGKAVTVLVELKARFDEANNIKWAKRLKKAGVTVLYTPPELKVHAKVALVRYKVGAPVRYAGLLATGNLNEGTARFYTDHILLTTRHELLEEVQWVFDSFADWTKKFEFRHLLVAQHNLQPAFLSLIDREIQHARQGKPARIIIKLNNLEERVLIKRLYDASSNGVQVDLIVRSICCLVPGVAGVSENIRIHRIVDRYLEHGRIYIFHNNGNPDVYLGSADWMNRNIYRRIEVCFPLYDDALKQELMELVDIQLKDSAQAVRISERLENLPVEGSGLQSQRKIYERLAEKEKQQLP